MALAFMRLDLCICRTILSLPALFFPPLKRWLNLLSSAGAIFIETRKCGSSSLTSPCYQIVFSLPPSDGIIKPKLGDGSFRWGGMGFKAPGKLRL
jgi:hypothetical protein